MRKRPKKKNFQSITIKPLTNLSDFDKCLNILKVLPDIIYHIDPKGNFIFLSNAVEMLGYKSDELIGRHFSVIVHPDDVKQFGRQYVLPKYKGKITGDENAPKLFDERRTGSRKTKNLEIRLLPKKKKDLLYAEVIAIGDISATGHYDHSGNLKPNIFLGTIGIIRDISMRKQSEAKLVYQAAMLENVSDAIISTDLDFNIRTWNLAAERMYGWKFVEVEGKPLHQVTKLYYPCNNKDKIEKQFFKKGHWQGDVIQQTKDGTTINVQSSVVLMKDHAGNPIGSVAVNRDITERKQAEHNLLSMINEKEALLKELHHRVKNNLQIVSSLLNLQSFKTDDNSLRNILRDSQNRIKTMVLVHEKLYQSQEFSHINAEHYIKSICHYLFDSYGISQSHIYSIIRIDKIELNIDTAIPCGLIINELISNVVKYAFPSEHKSKKEKPKVAVEMRKNKKNLSLVIADNGIGISFDPSNPPKTTLGLQLVHALVEQIGGKIVWEKRNGTKVTIIFPIK